MSNLHVPLHLPPLSARSSTSYPSSWQKFWTRRVICRIHHRASGNLSLPKWIIHKWKVEWKEYRQQTPDWEGLLLIIGRRWSYLLSTAPLFFFPSYLALFALYYLPCWVFCRIFSFVRVVGSSACILACFLPFSHFLISPLHLLRATFLSLCTFPWLHGCFCANSVANVDEWLGSRGQSIACANRIIRSRQ